MSSPRFIPAQDQQNQQEQGVEPAPEAERARPESRQLLVSFAALVIIVAGVRIASRLVLTALLALFITLMIAPLARWLERLGLHRALAIGAVMLCVLALLVGFGLVLNYGLGDELTALAAHSDKIDELLSAGTGALASVGVYLSETELASRIADVAMSDRVGAAAQTLLSLLGTGVYVTVMVGFMLAESGGLRRKLDLALGHRQRRRESIEGAVARVRRYIWIKSLVSAATGVLAGLSCWIAGVDAPLLWGLLAFGLNYIPMVGSLLAALPPVLLALVQGPLVALGLGLAYVVINIVMAEVIEPMVLADHIGLSPAAILLSLLFWGWVFGRLDLPLPVPFTMVIVAYSDYSGEFGWLAVLLSSEGRVRELVHGQREGCRGEPSPRALHVVGPAAGTGETIAA